MVTRRDVLAISSLAVVESSALSSSSNRFQGLSASLAQLEEGMSGRGRLGVSVLDTRSRELVGHRTNERFAMCSTFKMLLAAAVLKRADVGRERLDRAIEIPPMPLIGNSPLTQEHAGTQMTIGELCHAIMTRSDNTAANLLLATLGGPPGIGRFAHSLGDTVTRLDRNETALNEAAPGDPRDTTSPAAMIRNLHTLLLGKILSAASRDQLTQWMIANKTRDERLRGGFPATWRVGDKTGSNGENTTNDIAVVWPVHSQPVLIAAYLTKCPGSESKRNAILAKVGHLVAASIESA